MKKSPDTYVRKDPLGKRFMKLRINNKYEKGRQTALGKFKFNEHLFIKWKSENSSTS